MLELPAENCRASRLYTMSRNLAKLWRDAFFDFWVILPRFLGVFDGGSRCWRGVKLHRVMRSLGSEARKVIVILHQVWTFAIFQVSLWQFYECFWSNTFFDHFGALFWFDIFLFLSTFLFSSLILVHFWLIYAPILGLSLSIFSPPLNQHSHHTLPIFLAIVFLSFIGEFRDNIGHFVPICTISAKSKVNFCPFLEFFLSNFFQTTSWFSTRFCFFV